MPEKKKYEGMPQIRCIQMSHSTIFIDMYKIFYLLFGERCKIHTVHTCKALDIHEKQIWSGLFATWQNATPGCKTWYQVTTNLVKVYNFHKCSHTKYDINTMQSVTDIFRMAKKKYRWNDGKHFQTTVHDKGLENW